MPSAKHPPQPSSSAQTASRPPEEIAEEQIRQLTRKGGTELFLSDLGLERAPASLMKLASLECLDLGGNKLHDLPAEIAQLQGLKELGLYQNRLSRVPQAVSSLRHLRALALGHNSIEHLPEWMGQLRRLVELNCESCGLRSLPLSLKNLRELRHLKLAGNPALGIPDEVLKKRPADILDYYFRLRKGARQEIREVKIIFVGRGAVGKTSLIKQIQKEPFDEHESTTHGIRISDCDVNLLSSNAKKVLGKVRAHVWDFGGQEIMHATHQFFMTRRSVYLIVVAGRTDKPDQQVEYWLRLIESLGGESPIIVVKNKFASEPFDIDQPGLKARYPQIAAFIETDCKTRLGIEKLGQAIERVVSKAPGVRELFPESWFLVKEALLNKDQNYLPFSEFRRLCEENGEKYKPSQEKLAVWLHELGIALNFREDQRLADTTVLDPHWVTRGIYAILTSPGLDRSSGLLREKDLGRFLRQRDIKLPEYPEPMRKFLLNLMRKFELSYPLPGKDSGDLVPQLLPAAQPKAVDKFPNENCTWLRFRYAVLPEGLVARFITRMHPFIVRRGLWKNGAILAHGKARAVVSGNEFDRTVIIRVHGPEAARYRLLAMIRSDFTTMHGQLHGLKPVEETAAEGASDVWMAVEDLRAHERNGDRSVRKIAAGETISISVREQLDALEPKLTRTIAAEQAKTGGGSRGLARARLEKVRVFVSYSHLDERVRKKDLAAILKVLENERLIQVWHDRRLVAGDDWNADIRKEINDAELILFLVSREFLISDYSQSVEAKIALRRARAGNVRIIPVVLRRCTWTDQPWARYQAIPSDDKGARPVQDWKPQSHAWQKVEEELRTAAEKIRNAAKHRV